MLSFPPIKMVLRLFCLWIVSSCVLFSESESRVVDGTTEGVPVGSTIHIIFYSLEDRFQKEFSTRIDSPNTIEDVVYIDESWGKYSVILMLKGTGGKGTTTSTSEEITLLTPRPQSTQGKFSPITLGQSVDWCDSENEFKVTIRFAEYTQPTLNDQGSGNSTLHNLPIESKTQSERIVPDDSSPYSEPKVELASEQLLVEVYADKLPSRHDPEQGSSSYIWEQGYSGELALFVFEVDSAGNIDEFSIKEALNFNGGTGGWFSTPTSSVAFNSYRMIELADLMFLAESMHNKKTPYSTIKILPRVLLQNINSNSSRFFRVIAIEYDNSSFHKQKLERIIDSVDGGIDDFERELKYGFQDFSDVHLLNLHQLAGSSSKGLGKVIEVRPGSPVVVELADSDRHYRYDLRMEVAKLDHLNASSYRGQPLFSDDHDLFSRDFHEDRSCKELFKQHRELYFSYFEFLESFNSSDSEGLLALESNNEGKIVDFYLWVKDLANGEYRPPFSVFYDYNSETLNKRIAWIPFHLDFVSGNVVFDNDLGKAKNNFGVNPPRTGLLEIASASFRDGLLTYFKDRDKIKNESWFKNLTVEEPTEGHLYVKNPRLVELFAEYGIEKDKLFFDVRGYIPSCFRNLNPNEVGFHGEVKIKGGSLNYPLSVSFDWVFDDLNRSIFTFPNSEVLIFNKLERVDPALFEFDLTESFRGEIIGNSDSIDLLNKMLLAGLSGTKITMSKPFMETKSMDVLSDASENLGIGEFKLEDLKYRYEFNLKELTVDGNIPLSIDPVSVGVEFHFPRGKEFKTSLSRNSEVFLEDIAKSMGFDSLAGFESLETVSLFFQKDKRFREKIVLNENVSEQIVKNSKLFLYNNKQVVEVSIPSKELYENIDIRPSMFEGFIPAVCVIVGNEGVLEEYIVTTSSVVSEIKIRGKNRRFNKSTVYKWDRNNANYVLLDGGVLSVNASDVKNIYHLDAVLSELGSKLDEGITPNITINTMVAYSSVKPVLDNIDDWLRGSAFGLFDSRKELFENLHKEVSSGVVVVEFFIEGMEAHSQERDIYIFSEGLNENLVLSSSLTSKNIYRITLKDSGIIDHLRRNDFKLSYDSRGKSEIDELNFKVALGTQTVFKHATFRLDEDNVYFYSSKLSKLSHEPDERLARKAISHIVVINETLNANYLTLLIRSIDRIATKTAVENNIDSDFQLHSITYDQNLLSLESGNVGSFLDEINYPDRPKIKASLSMKKLGVDRLKLAEELLNDENIILDQSNVLFVVSYDLGDDDGLENRFLKSGASYSKQLIVGDLETSDNVSKLENFILNEYNN